MFRCASWLPLDFQHLVAVGVLLHAAVTVAQTVVYEGSIRNQTVQESAKARLKLKYEGERVTGHLTTYPPLQGSGSVSGVRKEGKCVLSVVIDEDAVMELKGGCRDNGFDGGYVVTFEEGYRPQRGNFILKPVVEKQKVTGDPGKKETAGNGENLPPIGDYGVYQHTGTLGYDFLYRLRLLNEHDYVAYNGAKGNYSYDVKTRQFTFQSGPLTTYSGSYFTQEKGGVGKPKIVLRSKSAPASTDASSLLREYLYAFYRPEGIQ